MAQLTKRIGLGTLGLLCGFGAPRLAAQAWGLTASDPVGIARSGAGVAFGQSLEAASMNPALLASIRDHASAFLAVGQELQITQSTVQTNSQIQESGDRNRFLPSLGASWRLSDRWFLGLKLDEPFMRHVDMPLLITSRYQGQSMDLTTHRLELQGAWALSPNWSFGASLGATQIKYSWSNRVRLPLPANPAQAEGPGNGAVGLMEVGLQQEATKSVPSYSVGFRWAINPRWTLAGTYVGSMSTTLGLSSGLASQPIAYYSTDGYGALNPGAKPLGPVLQSLLTTQPGSGKLTLPGQATLGVRQRVNQILTWEADLRFVQASSTVLPGSPIVSGPSGPVTGLQLSNHFISGVGASLMGELTLGPRWMLRMGVSQASNIRDEQDVDPMVGGAKNFTVSMGFGYKVWTGELNFGYQFRQSQDVNTPNLDYAWDHNGVQKSTAYTRIEGMGHLWSIGFKKAF